MAALKERDPSRQAIKEMARLVGLELTDEQLEKLKPDTEAMVRNIVALEELDLGETEPAFIFRPEEGAD